ncbi:ATPase with role in protein import into the ER [Rhodotorula toruloides]
MDAPPRPLSSRSIVDQLPDPLLAAKTVEADIKKVQDWIDSEGATATAENFDEQREQLQAAVAPITPKVYSSGAGGDSSSSSSGYHDEL